MALLCRAHCRPSREKATRGPTSFPASKYTILNRSAGLGDCGPSSNTLAPKRARPSADNDVRR